MSDLATSDQANKKPRYYSPVLSIAMTVVIFLGSQLVGTALFVLVFMLTPVFGGLSGAQIEAKFTNDRWLYLALVAFIEAMMVGVMIWFMRKRLISVKNIGLNKLKAKYLAYAVLGYVAVFMLNVVVLSLMKAAAPGFDLDQKQDLGIDASVSGGALVPIFLALVVIPPFVEEFIMRGFLFTNLRANLSFWASAILVSLLFGLAHITQAKDGLFWSGAISFFTLSMVLCYLREKTGSLWSGIGVHMLQNGLAFTALYIWKVA